MLKNISNKFWQWYEKHKTVGVGIAAGLFLLQLVHLYWLMGQSFWMLSDVGESIILIVDFLEIPTLIGVSLVYLNQLRKGFQWKSVIYLLFLNSQWLHIFWITDEFVLAKFTGVSGAGLPVWLAWVAIFIDYLELPVIYDTVRKFLRSVFGNVDK